MRFLFVLLLVPLRVAGLLTLLIAGLVIAGLAYPWLAQPRRNRITRRWSALLLAVCGARLSVCGDLPALLARSGMVPGQPGRLLLINHISWIDIFAVNAVLPSRFVAKAEIGRWPLLGTLVTLAGTLYIERGRRHAVHAVNHKVAEHLQLGESVALFPEGTTTDGSELLPFHSNLIAPVMEAGGQVWPVALRYTEDGRPSRAAAFIGDDTLVRSIWNILTARRLAIEVALLDPVAADGETHPTRHHVAQAARERIAAYLGIGVG
jgi:1-acyl-sn-glycerol-3-phosphate acyltransferase